MRLIDADAIHIDIYGGRMNGKTTIADALEKAIKESPEIEAIPIGFIKQKINLEKSFAEATYATVYWKELIALWNVQKGRYHE